MTDRNPTRGDTVTSTAPEWFPRRMTPAAAGWTAHYLNVHGEEWISPVVAWVIEAEAGKSNRTRIVAYVLGSADALEPADSDDAYTLDGAYTLVGVYAPSVVADRTTISETLEWLQQRTADRERLEREQALETINGIERRYAPVDEEPA